MSTSTDPIPEHTKRILNGDLHPEVSAAYRYVGSVVHTADAQSPFGCPTWHGWAIREAFLAGCSHTAALAHPEMVPPTNEELDAWWEKCAELTREGKADCYWAFGDVTADYVYSIARAAIAADRARRAG
jgi:hypothetical protein